MVVGLAYLPDVAGQVGGLIGLANARVIAHSLLFAVVVAPLAGWCLSWVCGARLVGAILVSLVSVLLHDFLDLLQATDRQVWWPLSDRAVGLDLDVLPVNSVWELVVFGGAFGVFVVVTRRLRSGRGMSPSSLRPSVPSSLLSPGVLLSLGILAAASGTHYLRGVREARVDEVRVMLARGAHADALAVIEDARRWPSTAKPGWLDYAEGECFAGLGDRARAEVCYLRSLAADGAYFWAVADLAVLFASGDEPVVDRRRRAAPWVRRLRDEFATHVDLERVLGKVELRLNGGS